MKEDITVPLRLKTISCYLSAGATFADIGSDHALLPIYVCLHDPNAKAIAGEVNKGPYQQAKENVNRYQLNHMIDVRLGNGLAVVRPNEINELIIAGMGGSLISSILENDRDKLSTVNKVILQPNIHARKVRQWLMKNGFCITDETIVKENGHFYEIMIGQPSQVTLLTNDISEQREKELIFGPLLLQEKTIYFRQKWTEEKTKLKQTITQMKKARIKNVSKIMQFERELKWIEEVLS